MRSTGEKKGNVQYGILNFADQSLNQILQQLLYTSRHSIR